MSVRRCIKANMVRKTAEIHERLAISFVANESVTHPLFGVGHCLYDNLPYRIEALTHLTSKLC